ncbi:hypothetical protein TWF481_002853 [Arthrobotrys musiformis]|uniref:Protein kinase domain-containing protein n=1 Tax=Arthrobotrys musiformis TaxID=47236 RepID=A0AAV9VRF7_9PEZI
MAASNRHIRPCTQWPTTWIASGENVRSRPLVNPEPIIDEAEEEASATEIVAAMDDTASRRKQPVHVIKEQRFVGIACLNVEECDEKLILKLLRNHHENTTTLAEVFSDQTNFYLIVEVLDISLAEIISSAVSVEEPQAAFIYGEIVKSLNFLSHIGVEHTAVQARNILLDQYGHVKLGGIQHCRLGSGQSFSGVGRLAFHMLDRLEPTSSSIRAADLQRSGWSGDVKQFITNSMWTSFVDIQQEPFLKQSGGPDSIIPLAVIATLSAKRQWLRWEYRK